MSDGTVKIEIKSTGDDVQFRLEFDPPLDTVIQDTPPASHSVAIKMLTALEDEGDVSITGLS